jgi:putative DNA primase/helicase
MWDFRKIWAYCKKGNELGMAYMFAHQIQGEAMYVREWDEWLVWNGTYWHRDLAEERMTKLIEQRLSPILEQAFVDVETALNESAQASDKADKEVLERMRKDIDSALKKARSVNGVKNILEFSHKCNIPVCVDASDLDNHPGFLATQNALVNMRTMQVIEPPAPEHRSKYLITKVAPVTFDPQAKCPKFDKFLADLFDEEMRIFVQKLFGYIASGVCTEHIFPILHGQGRNGKTVLVNIVSRVLGDDLAIGINTELLYEQKFRGSAGPSPDIRALHGCRFAFASEVNETQRLDVARIKKLTGGDTIVARAPHEKREFRWRPTHTIILLTNANPRLDTVDYAFADRLLFIPFKYSFVDNPTREHEKPRIKGLEHIIVKEEASGVLNWLIEGFIRYDLEGLKPPDEVKKAVQTYLEMEDLIGYFLYSCTTPAGQEVFLPLKDLYKVYSEWCVQEQGMKEREIPALRAFARQMAHKYKSFRKGEQKVTGYCGLVLNEKGQEYLRTRELNGYED